MAATLLVRCCPPLRFFFNVGSHRSFFDDYKIVECGWVLQLVSTLLPFCVGWLPLGLSWQFEFSSC